MFMHSGRWKLVLPLVLIALVLSLGGWRMWEVGRYQRALDEISKLMSAGRNGMAARNLESLLDSRPGSDEVLYLLGVCERARGRPAEASRAWSRVRPKSSFWGRAMYGLAELKIESGQLDQAEDLIKSAQKNAAENGAILNALLVPIYCMQGRFAEAGRLIEAQWEGLERKGEGASEKAVNLLRLRLDFQQKIAPVAARRSYLEQAAKKAPDDDRVWLGQAELLIHDGSFEEAARLLDTCLRRRPDDVPVWRARLRLAMATNQLEAARQALKHLPLDDSAPGQIPRLAAWIARQHGDVDAEERALELLIEAEPAELAARTRLAELAQKSGRPDRVAELQKKNKAIEELRARYQKLRERNQPVRDAVEMARLAEQLGNPFEARAFLTVALAEHPGRDDLRTELDRLTRPHAPDATPDATPAPMLADVLAPELKE